MIINTSIANLNTSALSFLSVGCSCFGETRPVRYISLRYSGIGLTKNSCASARTRRTTTKLVRLVHVLLYCGHAVAAVQIVQYSLNSVVYTI